MALPTLWVKKCFDVVRFYQTIFLDKRWKIWFVNLNNSPSAKCTCANLGFSCSLAAALDGKERPLSRCVPLRKVGKRAELAHEVGTCCSGGCVRSKIERGRMEWPEDRWLCHHWIEHEQAHELCIYVLKHSLTRNCCSLRLITCHGLTASCLAIHAAAYEVEGAGSEGIYLGNCKSVRALCAVQPPMLRSDPVGCVRLGA